MLNRVLLLYSKNTKQTKKSMKTTKGLIDFLIRKGEKPTGDKDKDIAMAKKYLPKPYKESKNESS